MNGVCAYGVVQDGRIVLDAPLALADGTRVAVVEPTAIRQPVEGDNSSVGLNKLFKTEDERREAAEKAILEMAGLWAARAELADPEKWVRELRGAGE